jgi:hypothetical protein
MNKRINTFAEAGDVEYWPFLSKAEYESAIKEPKLLSGR